MKFIGAHVSASGGVEAAPVNASEIGQMLLPCLPRPASVGGKAADGGEYQGV